MKTITLAAGATHVPFNEVAHLIAYAIHPETSDDDNPASYHFALIDFEKELKKAAKLGILPVKNPLTLGVWESPMGNAFNHVLVTVDDLRAFVADKYIKVVVEALEPQAAPEQNTATQGASDCWTLIKPQRFPGYRKPLYDLIKAAHIAGQPTPKARDVLDKWKQNPPDDVESVTDNGLKYYDAKGNTKPADLEAIRKAIARMIQ